MERWLCVPTRSSVCDTHHCILNPSKLPTVSAYRVLQARRVYICIPCFTGAACVYLHTVFYRSGVCISAYRVLQERRVYNIYGDPRLSLWDTHFAWRVDDDREEGGREREGGSKRGRAIVQEHMPHITV